MNEFSVGAGPCARPESMNEWREVKLGEVVQSNPSEHLSKDRLYKKIAMEKLQPFKREIEGYELSKFSGGTKFRNGDTLLARITPCLENGKTAQVRILEDAEVGFGSTEYIVLREQVDVTANDYLYYLAISAAFRDAAIKSMTGTTGRQRVQSDLLKNLSINLPPLPEQRAIAATLSCLDDKIELNRRINSNLEELAQAIFKRWFVDFEFPDENGKPYKSSGGAMVNSELGMIPEGWREGTLGEICNITMGQSPPGESYNEIGNGMPFYQGRTDFGFRFPKKRIFTNAPKRLAKQNDTLVSVRAPVGDMNIAIEDCCIGRGLAAVIEKNGNRTFTHYILRELTEKFKSFEATGTVFGSINKTDFEKMKCIVANQRTVFEFEVVCSPVDDMILNNELSIIKISAVRDTLLPKLISGEIRVPVEMP